MKKASAILVVLLGAGASSASTVPVMIDVPSLVGGISVGAFEIAAGGVGAGGTPIAALCGIGGGVLATGNGALMGGAAGEVVEDGVWGGGGYFPVSPGLGDQDTGADAPRPPMNVPALPEVQKGDGGGGGAGTVVVMPLPGAGAMGMAGLLCIAGTTRRRRV